MNTDKNTEKPDVGIIPDVPVTFYYLSHTLSLMAAKG